MSTEVTKPAGGNHPPTWKERLDMRRKLRLPKSIRLLTKNGRRKASVSGAAMGKLLDKIDDHAGGSGACWARHQTLADETGYSVDTVARACDALQRLGLIRKWRQKCDYGFTCNHYRIVWPRVSEFTVDPTEKVLELPFADDDQTGTVPPTKPAQSADQTGTVQPTKPAQCPPPNRHEGGDIEAPLKRNNEAPWSGSSERLFLGRHLEAKDLIDLAAIRECFKAAAGLGIVDRNSDRDVLHFIAWGHYCYRQGRRPAPKGVRNPVGLFVARLTTPDRHGKLWRDKFDDEHDVAFARRQLLEAQRAKPTSAAVAAAAEQIGAIHDVTLSREQQLAAMALEFGRGGR